MASAKAAILALWEAEGVEAARLGTKLHLHCEYDLNVEPLPRDAEISDEIAQFEAFKASAEYTSASASSPTAQSSALHGGPTAGV